MSTFVLIQHRIGSLNHSNPTGKEIKVIQIGQEAVKLSLFADDMMPIIENLKESTKKLWELINKFSKVAGYKFNVQELVAFLYTNKELPEREIKIIPFTVASKNKIPRNKFKRGVRLPVLGTVYDVEERS